MTRITVSTEKKHEISPYLYMQFAEPLGVCDTSIDAGWDFIENRWHGKLVDKIRELSPTMIRFGGCFASYYHWKEAVGPRPDRVPMLNYCWGAAPYHNQVGTHEIADLCRQVEAQPLFVVNMESDGRRHWSHPKNGTVRLGTAEEAAEWVAYCNDPDHPLRRAHGCPEPLNVRYWQIGNETSYDARGFTSAQCQEITRRFAEKMRAADPSICLIGWGDEGKNGDDWCRRMSEVDEVEMIAFHHHFGSGLPDSPLVGTEYRKDPDETWQHLMHAHKSLEAHIGRMRADCGKKRLAMTEGHFILPGRNRNEVLSSWGAGVAYARCLNVIHRNSDVIDIATMADFFGNVWQVNAILLPTPIHNGPAYLQPVGAVMSLFRHHQGKYAADVTVIGDVDAAASMDEGKIHLHLANTERTKAQKLSVDLGGRAVKEAKIFWIAAPSDTEITPSNPDVFAVQSASVDVREIPLPPAAVAAVEIEME